MMDPATVASLIMFCFATSITPGPNNMTLAASGVSQGVKRTIPVTLGTAVGFAGLLMLSGIGIAAIVSASELIEIGLKIAGVAYLLYLSFKLWNAGASTERTAERPLRFWHGTALQLVNPKAWTMAVSSVSVFVASAADFWPRQLLVTAIFVAVGLPCSLAWVLLGAGMKAALRDERRQRLLNRAMAFLTAASAALVIFW